MIGCFDWSAYLLNVAHAAIIACVVIFLFAKIEIAVTSFCWEESTYIDWINK